MAQIKKKSFSLMELLIVVVIIGIIGGMSISSFENAVTARYTKHINMSVESFKAAQRLYWVRHGVFWVPAGPTYSSTNLAGINQGLGTDLVPFLGMNFTASGASDGSTATFGYNATYGTFTSNGSVSCTSGGTC